MTTKIIPLIFAACCVCTAHAAVGDSIAERRVWLASLKSAEVAAKDVVESSKHLKLNLAEARSQLLFEAATQGNGMAHLSEEIQTKSDAGKLVGIPRGTLTVLSTENNITQCSEYIRETVIQETYTLGSGDWNRFSPLLLKILAKNGNPKDWLHVTDPSGRSTRWEIRDAERNTIRSASLSSDCRTLTILDYRLQDRLTDEIAAEKARLDKAYQEATEKVIR